MVNVTDWRNVEYRFTHTNFYTISYFAKLMI